jgi:hypothetical protein
MPVFSLVIEKYIFMNIAQTLKDSVDITNIAVYNALSAESLSRGDVDFDTDRARMIYNRLLAENLSLEVNLMPQESSVAEGQVRIDSLILYSGGFPHVCPDGTEIVRPTVHSVVAVPVKPMLYRQIILNALGKESVELIVHVDSEIPVNK